MIERRQSPRVALSESVEVRDADQERVLGRLMNLSHGGFMVISDEPLEPRATYHLEAQIPAVDGGARAVPMTAVCMWCQRSGYSEAYGAGFAFETVPDELTRTIDALLSVSG